MSQLNLFDQSGVDSAVDYKPAEGHKMRPLSIAARVKASNAQRAIVLQFILDRRAYGATGQEVCLATGIEEKSFTWRKRELIKSGDIVETDRKRATTSGAMAAVLVAKGNE